jgi:DNA-binding MarR family transcriptional regulator
MDIPSACHCINLRRAAQAITHLYDEALEPSGLKITQFSLLRAVQRRGPVSISALAEEMQLDRTTLGRNLHVLEREGLVSFSSGNDQRERTVLLTDAGKTAIATAKPLWEQAQTRITELVGKEQLETLTALLVKVQTIAP